MGTSAEERQIIREVLDLVDNETTHMLDGLMDNPVTRYTDPDQLDQEINTLFRNFPIVMAHVSELAEPGAFITNDDTGVPILITRTQQGEVKALLNVCRHRGARVEDRPCGKARAFTCPYHAWVYAPDGELKGMPQAFGFDAMDRSGRGLVELPAFERYGLVWVVPSVQPHEVDIDAWLAPMNDHFERIDMASHVIFETWALNRNMSWRFAVEGFQESYHFCSAHRESACSNYLDNQSLHIDYRPHTRHAVPLPRVLELRDQPEQEWDYRPNFMTQNYLFPANFVQAMTDHVFIHTIIPTGPGRCIFKCMMLIPEAPASDKAERYWRANYDVVRTVFEEDFTIGEGIQKGLASGANDTFVFGTYECGLHFGQKAIDDALVGDLKVPTLGDRPPS